jgi:hypothetical protein
VLYLSGDQGDQIRLLGDCFKEFTEMIGRLFSMVAKMDWAVF